MPTELNELDLWGHARDPNVPGGGGEITRRLKRPWKTTIGHEGEDSLSTQWDGKWQNLHHTDFLFDCSGKVTETTKIPFLCGFDKPLQQMRCEPLHVFVPQNFSFFFFYIHIAFTCGCKNSGRAASRHGEWNHVASERPIRPLSFNHVRLVVVNGLNNDSGTRWDESGSHMRRLTEKQSKLI